MSQLAAVDHMYNGISEAFLKSATYALHEPNDIVKYYTSAPRIKKNFEEKQKAEKIGMVVGSAVGLAVAAGFVFNPGTTAASVNLVACIHVPCTDVSTLNTNDYKGQHLRRHQ